VDALYAPQRALLDRLLVDAASAAGAHVVHEVGLQGLVRAERGRVTGAVLRDRTGAVHRVEADIVIGADGIRSTVARLAEARTYRMGRHASAVVYGHWAGLCLDGYQWHYRPGVSVGAIPTNNGETCVFVAVPAARFLDLFRGDVGGGHARLLRGAAPELGALVERSEQTGNFHGFAGQTGFFRQSWGPGWALVGDAGYFKDPLTAHGITDALRDAARLSTAVVDGSEGALAEYQSGRDILATDLFDVTDAIASFAWNLAEVRLLHEKLAAAMAREVTSIATDEHQPASREAPPPSSARGRTGPDSPAQAVHPE
jgi:flavin-dependent dehydrogenase